MNLPQNGRVVVIDDSLSEAIPLMKLLSQNNVPMSYFSGVDSDDFPDQPLDSVRFVFLDIVLGNDLDNTKTKVSNIIRVIKKIISLKNPPFAILAWSKHESDQDEGSEDITQLIENGLKREGYHIISCLKLSKLDYFETELNESGELKYVVRARTEDGVEVREAIKMKLKEVLDQVNAFKVFIEWENLVHRSASEIVKDFSSFHLCDPTWSTNTLCLFYALASAYLGHERVKMLTSETGGEVTQDDIKKEEVIKNSLLTFNSVFLDTLENNINKTEFSLNSLLKPAPKLDLNIIGKINSKLITSTDETCSSPGNVYKEGTGSKKSHIPDINIFFNKALPKDFLSKIKKVFIEVSPSCDYAQNKWLLHRIVEGFLFPVSSEYKIKSPNPDYLYSMRPSFYLDGEVYQLAIDFRLLTGIEHSALLNIKPIFRLRRDILVDIQSQLSRHINRPGIINL